jgi:DNA-binding FadR family transcriptional regulator
MEPSAPSANAVPLRRSSLVDDIAERLKSEILAGRYAPGHRLPGERQLAEALGVTRVSLKHALVRLEQLGLIRTRHGVGSVIQDYQTSAGAELLSHLSAALGQPSDASLLEELLDARTLIISGFVRLAARRRTPKHVAELRQLLSELAAHNDKPAEVQRLEHELFRTLARGSRNRPFVFLTNSVSRAYQNNLAAYAAQFQDGKWVARALTRIVEAVEARDEDGARIATESYFREAAKRVLSARRGG